MGREIKQPFQFINGALATTESLWEQVEAHIWSLLMTRFGERLMLPDYGSPAWALLFEPTSVVRVELSVSLQDGLNKYEPRAVIFSVDSKETSEDVGSGVELRISYGIRGVDDTREVTVRLAPGQTRVSSAASLESI